MSTIAQVSQAMQTVLTSAAEAADRQLHYTKRPDRAKFTASSLVQTLVLGWLAHPDASLDQLAQTAARVGVSVSPQAIDQRFTLATARLLRTVLSAALEHTIHAEPVAIPLLQRFCGVFVHDGTTIALPDALHDEWAGCGGRSAIGTAAALKCGVQLDLLTGSLSALDLADGRTADSRLPCQQARLPKGSLRLADLGFFDLRRFAVLERDEVYFLSRVRLPSSVTARGLSRLDLLSFVTQHAAQGYDDWVMVGKEQPVRVRLLVAPVPASVAAQRRQRLRKEAREKGQPVSAVALQLASWTILMTNAPSELLSLSEALVLMRVRWQIELLFKLWKSEGQLARWRSEKPARILCEVYAKLLAMLLQQWMLQLGCWQYADRSLTKAAAVVRDHAGELACARADVVRIGEVLETIQRILTRTARMNTRLKHPNTYQRLLALTAVAEEA